MSDFQAMFRAAKSSGGKLTKEQLKAMKAQKAAALARDRSQEPATAPSTTSSEQAARSMPPPPPRLSAADRQVQAGVSYHADSQGTRLNDGGALLASNLQSEPSVTNRGGRAPRGAARPANALSDVGSTGLPTGFFEADSVVAEGGGGPGASTAISGGGEGAAGAVAGGARSAEGSTGGVLGGRGAGNAADLANSAISPPPGARRAGHDVSGPAAALAFEEGGSPEAQAAPGPASSAAQEPAAPLPAAASARGGGGGTLPKGFFADAAADAEARGEGPKKRSAAELDKEFSTFLKEVETDGEVAAAAAAEVEEDNAEDRQGRDEFEHFVRMERLRELREEASARLKSGALSHTGADPPQLATALELAGIRPEAPPPEIRLSKRRKVADTLAMLEEQGGDSDNEEEEEGEGEGAAMDWRSKSTA